jgi:hypothetical protein
LVDAGRLCRRHDDRLPPPLKRHLLVAPEIEALFVKSAPLPPLFTRYSALQVTGWYTQGWSLKVALTQKPGGYKRGQHPDLERLDDVDEVWAMCFRDPGPGWRMLGRFVEKDTFIGLTIHDRHALTKGAYKVAAEAVIPIWEDLFRADQLLRGDTIYDYLSGPIRDANESL